jgi:transposase InsO family protein
LLGISCSAAAQRVEFKVLRLLKCPCGDMRSGVPVLVPVHGSFVPSESIWALRLNDAVFNAKAGNNDISVVDLVIYVPEVPA